MKRLMLKAIKFYQDTKIWRRPIFKQLYLTDAACRFRPTCSQYCYSAVEKYGIIRGSLLGLKRILKCHPWNRGGCDPLK